MSKYWRKQLLSSLAIFLFGGTFNVIMNLILFESDPFELSYFLTENFWLTFSYSGFGWMGFWKGSELFVEFWDRKIPWVESPIKRFIVSLVSVFVFVFAIVWILDLAYDLLYFKKSLSDALIKSGIPYWHSLLITLGLNIFMHGRGFLYSWRQVSIDMEKLRTEQVSTKYESLKNQVNPHFLFNSLNALTSLVYDDQAKAVEFIRKLSQVYRYVLDKKDEELVPFSDDLGFAENYIFLQKIRFGDNLKIEIEGEAINRYVPPIAIQLLIENAIKHNVVSELHPLTIKLVIENDHFTITNNIKEKLEKDSTGIGLENLKARYQYLSDKKIEINRDEKVFSVKVPLLKLEE